MQVQLLPGALNMARSSIGLGYQALILARRVRFPHGLLDNTTKWRNWKTLDAQNVVPQGMGVRLSPWSLIAGAAGVQLAFIRPVARFDTGACNCGWA